jgi:hypothetical protein
LRRACRRGQPQAVRDELLAWAARCWPQQPPRALGALAERLDDRHARRALDALERSLYGPPGDAAQDADVLAGIVRQVKRSRRLPHAAAAAGR